MACNDVLSYIMEEGTLDYLDEVIVFMNGGSATVWEHIKKSIDFCMNNLGENGFPLMLDLIGTICFIKYAVREKAESIWTGMQSVLFLE